MCFHLSKIPNFRLLCTYSLEKSKLSQSLPELGQNKDKEYLNQQKQLCFEEPLHHVHNSNFFTIMLKLIFHLHLNGYLRICIQNIIRKSAVCSHSIYFYVITSKRYSCWNYSNQEYIYYQQECFEWKHCMKLWHYLQHLGVYFHLPLQLHNHYKQQCCL